MAATNQPAASRESDDGSARVERPGASAVLVRLRGRLEPEWAAWLTATLENELAGGALTLFVDTHDLDAFGAGFKSHMIGWVRAHREQLSAAHVLTTSPIIRMAAAVANMATGGFITAHGARESFDDALSVCLKAA